MCSFLSLVALQVATLVPEKRRNSRAATEEERMLVPEKKNENESESKSRGNKNRIGHTINACVSFELS